MVQIAETPAARTFQRVTGKKIDKSLETLKNNPLMANLRPGLTQGIYPERPLVDPAQITIPFLSTIARVRKTSSWQNSFRRNLEQIKRHCKDFQGLKPSARKEYILALKRELHRHGIQADLLAQSFAIIRETAGQTIGMRHFDSQLMGGWILANGGLAEMETGEGKTLTATLAAGTAAFAGTPVHVITVNDYLAQRDAELMKPVYEELGLSVGAATANMGTGERRQAYRCDITYCTGKQLAFDYLRDRIILGADHGRLRLQLEQLHTESPKTDELLLRGLCFAIVDEADSVLIDEASTPLIISREKKNPEEVSVYQEAMQLTETLKQGIDFSIDISSRQVELLPSGFQILEGNSKPEDSLLMKQGSRRANELITRALAARHLYHRDEHYLVAENKVVIIDENTGRTMADRSWERGLHQMIEIKERCPVSGEREHIARLTYQRFFSRFLTLSGMTGTAREVKNELWRVYRLPVVTIPTNKPSQRMKTGQHIYSSKAEKWHAAIKRITELNQCGQPVLIGTRSVADSEFLSDQLSNLGLSHELLNARQDSREAEIIAQAGQPGSITIATNMAGRGTDISLKSDDESSSSAELGGLHIISLDSNESSRIDRQLYGRCGRQGDPGSYEAILSLEDQLLQEKIPEQFRSLLQSLVRKKWPGTQAAGSLLIYLGQHAKESQYRRTRKRLVLLEEHINNLVGFTGGLE